MLTRIWPEYVEQSVGRIHSIRQSYLAVVELLLLLASDAVMD